MSSSTPDGPADDRPATPEQAPHEADHVPADAAPAEDVDPAAGAETDRTPEGDAPASEEPQEVTLLVDPDRVRRAPKVTVFLWVGALVGAVVGLIFSTWLIDVSGSAETLMKPGVYVSVTVLGGIALGLGVAGLLAVIADRRSLRRR